MTNFKKWIAAAGIRALKTVAQTAVATMEPTATKIPEIVLVIQATTLAHRMAKTRILCQQGLMVRERSP